MQFVSAHQYLSDDRAAQAYVTRRFRDLQALCQDLATDNGYVTVTRTETGIQVKTRTETLMATSYVAAQAFVLARFW